MAAAAAAAAADKLADAMTDVLIVSDGDGEAPVAAPEPPKTWTWRERVAAMTSPPRLRDYPNKGAYNTARSMYVYYTDPEARARQNAERMARATRARAASGATARGRGRPPKVFDGPIPVPTPRKPAAEPVAEPAAEAAAVAEPVVAPVSVVVPPVEPERAVELVAEPERAEERPMKFMEHYRRVIMALPESERTYAVVKEAFEREYAFLWNEIKYACYFRRQHLRRFDDDDVPGFIMYSPAQFKALHAAISFWAPDKKGALKQRPFIAEWIRDPFKKQFHSVCGELPM